MIISWPLQLKDLFCSRVLFFVKFQITMLVHDLLFAAGENTARTDCLCKCHLGEKQHE